jgi:hypothetical protein
MNRRTFTAAEIARLFKAQANEGNAYSVELGEGFRAVQQAAHSGLVFQIERNGAAHALADADAAELEEISGIIRARFEPFINMAGDTSLDDLLMPDGLRDKPDDPNLEPDPLGLMPDALRAIIKNPELARKLATGTATAQEKLDAELTPDELLSKPEENPLGYPGEE